MGTQRHTIPYPDEINALAGAINANYYLAAHTCVTSGAIGNGGTAGRLRITATTPFKVAGALYSKASTDDLWNLSGETATASGKYRAYHLYLAADGTASISAAPSADSSSAALALLQLPAIPSTKSVIGVFVAGPSTDFTSALSSQGTIYNGLPAASLAHWSDATQAAIPLTYAAA